MTRPMHTIPTMTEAMKEQFKKSQPMPGAFDDFKNSGSTEVVKVKNKKRVVKKNSDFDIDKAKEGVMYKKLNGNRKYKTRQSYTKNQVIQLLEISLKGHGINPDTYDMEEYFKILEDIMDGKSISTKKEYHEF